MIRARGTPCDTQLATYLLEADVVLSGDWGFISRFDIFQFPFRYVIAHTFTVAGARLANDCRRRFDAVVRADSHSRQSLRRLRSTDFLPRWPALSVQPDVGSGFRPVRQDNSITAFGLAAGLVQTESDFGSAIRRRSSRRLGPLPPHEAVRHRTR